MLILMILSGVDSLRLIFMLIWGNITYYLHKASILDIGCRVSYTVDYFLQYISIWLVLLLTLERLIAVCFRMKAAAMCTISNARRSVICLFGLDAVICSM
jgi:hypothetical protein